MKFCIIWLFLDGYWKGIVSFPLRTLSQDKKKGRWWILYHSQRNNRFNDKPITENGENPFEKILRNTISKWAVKIDWILSVYHDKNVASVLYYDNSKRCLNSIYYKFINIIKGFRFKNPAFFRCVLWVN